MAELRRSHSNYTLNKKRQLTTKGRIYERDWMTVSELGGFAPGTLPVYASGNFKMTINNERSGKKKYSFSNWALNDNGDAVWDLSSINEEELKIKSELIKPNYSSILDFAYYGSAVELIHGTVNDIISKYPGELYTAGYNIAYGATNGEFAEIKNVVENPFEIDIWTEYVNQKKIDNHYRYMCISWDKYEIIEATGDTTDVYEGEPVTSWTPATEHYKPCFNGDLVFKGATINGISFDGYYLNGKTYVTCGKTGMHIRLQKKYIDECFDGFDDFEKVLLNRDSKPKYKAKFYTPKETEIGVVTHEISYIWPTLKGKWNLDFETQTYESYIDGLLYIATYYDEYRSDNIWRSYTHESIKNFDWTTPKDTYVPEIDGDIIDTERLESILRVCGRQFDDLKRYLENIKYTVNVSYDSKNNMPDEAMAKFLEMSGWEVKNVSPISDNSFIHREEYPGKIVKMNAEDSNKEFLKRMILNSRNILSKKGTRSGIEAIYSMFGIFDLKHGYTIDNKIAGFTIDEYDAFATKYISGEEFEDVVNMNSEKNGYSTQFENTSNELCGLMGDYKFDVNGVKYIVPWYNMNDEYDGYAYYQMLGGWGKHKWRQILLDLAPEIGEIESDSDFSIYDETVKNVKVVESFKELNDTPIGFLDEGDVYYVLNLSNNDCTTTTAHTHYVFFAKTSNIPGDFTGDTVKYSNEYVWCLVDYDDFKKPLSSWAKKILYLESIHDNSIGNNPHNGNGKYDDGREYFEYYNQIFKGAFDNDMFSDYQARINAENAKRHYENRFRTNKLDDLTASTESIKDIGFGISDLVPDNEKIWLFLDYDNGLYDGYTGWTEQFLSKREFDYKRKYSSTEPFLKLDERNFELKYEDREYQNKPITLTGSTITTTGGTLDIPSEIKSYNPGHVADFTYGHSVINTKNIKIRYELPWELEDYVTDVVEFYVKQLMPSTAIVEFEYDGSKWGTRPKRNRPDTYIKLSPAYQILRSYETSADIGIEKLNVESVAINNEL